MSARAAAQRALVQFHRRQGERIAELLDVDSLDARDRAFANELVHGVVRNERFLDAVLNCYAHRGLPRDPLLMSTLRLGAFQLLLLGGVPARAAVHATVELVRKDTGFVNAILRRIADSLTEAPADPKRPLQEIAVQPQRTLRLPKPLVGDASQLLAVRHSLPDFMVARWTQAHGAAAAAAIAAAATTVPAVALRPCGGRDAATLAAQLLTEGVQTEVDGAIARWTGGESPFGTQAFRDGAFVVQDPTAVRAVTAVAAAPGETIVDLCAAPGTKSTLLAERVAPNGVVLAWDVDAERRARIGENAERLRLQATLRVLDSANALPDATADAVLADVPCSNTGVLGRRVEVRRRLRPESFAQMARTQGGILQQALRCVRPGGRIVYSTCSIEPEENEEVVRAALGADLQLERSELTLPQAGRCDGGYFAVLRRTGIPAPVARG